jgi:hypothetical protein
MFGNCKISERKKQASRISRQFVTDSMLRRICGCKHRSVAGLDRIIEF